MGSNRRDFLLKAGAAAASTAMPCLSTAAEYPDRAVKLIIPYPAGGGGDIYSRAVATRLEKVLGHPLVFDYRPGGSTAIGAEAVARSPADGYTIGYLDSGAFALVPNLRKVAYDPAKSFVPIAHLGVVPYVLAVSADTPFRSIQELIAKAKEAPDKYTMASSGVGSAHHVIGELFKMRAGISMRHVPYKGGAQYVTDLASGQVDSAISTINIAMPFVQSGRIRLLGITAGKRSLLVPEVPTIAEQGIPGFDAKPWVCYVAPAGTPAPVVDALRTAFRATYQDAEVLASLQRGGVEDVGQLTPAQVGELMQEDRIKWGEAIRKANITVDG